MMRGDHAQAANADSGILRSEILVQKTDNPLSTNREVRPTARETDSQSAKIDLCTKQRRTDTFAQLRD